MEISFREAIKLVHPDSNPDVIDAGTKCKTVKLYRNDPVKLHRLLTRWGLLQTKPLPQIERTFIDSLLPNHIYNGNTWIQHKNGFYKVMRTTTKRVYLDGGYMNTKDLTFCHINSVINAFEVIEKS